MAEIQVSQADVTCLSALLPTLDGPPAAKELLAAFVDAVTEAIDGETDELIVSVEVEPAVILPEEPSITEQFDTAFVAEAAAAPSGNGVKVQVFKVGR